MNRFPAILFFVFLFLMNLSARDILGPRFRFLLNVRQAGLTREYEIPPFRQIPITITFRSDFTESAMTRLRAAGIQPKMYRGQPLRSKRVLVGLVDPVQFKQNALRNIPDLLEVETTWRPHHAYPLFISRPQIEAEQVWQMTTPPTTGKGVLIADLDTGINLFQPMFFFADGDTVSWTDVNQNGQFDPGTDGVDLDGSGAIGATEKLRFIQIDTSPAMTNPAGYNPSLDWIYVDVNQNQQRDYGPGAGFTEADPAYGEPIFITLDANGNDTLDVGEKLVMLKTSKVRKFYQSDGVIRERGVDMILNEGDYYYGHGTPVSGILLGGVAGVHKFAGIAPDAELLMGTNVYIPDPPFIQTMEFLAPWAAAEGADIILYEDGEWVWQYMDGSAALETMIDDFSDQGILQVVPAGNLAGGGMHTSWNIPAQDSVEVPLKVVYQVNQSKVWGNFLWLGDSAGLTFKLKLTSGSTPIPLPGDGSFITSGSYQIYSLQSRSPRGTNRMDFIIFNPTYLLHGTFTFILRNRTNGDIFFHAYEVDNMSGWSGATRWQYENDDGTVTWPATADKAFTVGGYKPRSPQMGLNSFSGRGNRIDGMRLVDITAPGSIVYSTMASYANYGGITTFGGTSSAGPHVAGGCALLIQLLGHHDVPLIKNSIANGANTTSIGSPIPNPGWGYGRVRLKQAADYMLTPLPPSPGEKVLPSGISLVAYPNPFNPSTRIRLIPDQSGEWHLTIFNLLGQKTDEWKFSLRAGIPVEVNWTADNRPAGIYFAAVTFGEKIRAVYKLFLVK